MTEQPTSSETELRELGRRPALPAYVSAVWRRREFILSLPLGQLRSRNANTVLGSLWHLLNPVALAATYYVVFGIFFEARDDVDNYVGFLLSGLFVFYYTQKCLTSGASTIVANDAMIRNIAVPRAAFPSSAVVAETLVHLPALALLMVVLVLTGEAPRPAWLLVLPLLALHVVFNLGLALWVGRLTFHFRDMQNLLPFALRILLYLSGVFFTAERVPDGILRTLFELNPLQVIIRLHRELLFSGTVSAETWAQGVFWAAVSFSTGVWFFWSSESRYGRD